MHLDLEEPYDSVQLQQHAILDQIPKEAVMTFWADSLQLLLTTEAEKSIPWDSFPPRHKRQQEEIESGKDQQAMLKMLMFTKGRRPFGEAKIQTQV
jgi:hypothetical protein